MANERYSNNYLTVIGKETEYGKQQLTYAVILPDKLELKKTIASIDIAQKTGVLTKKNTEKLAGYTGGTGAQSGDLVPGVLAASTLAIMLEALFQDTGTPFIVPAIGTVPLSYSLFQFFNDDNANTGTGCVLESLDIAGSGGGAITYAANWRSQEVLYEATPTLVGGDPFGSIPSVVPAVFALTTLDLFGGDTNITKLNSFSLSLKNTFVEDPLIYQNSNKKIQEIIKGFEGSLNIEWNYDKENDDDISGKLMSNTLTTVTFTISNGSQDWTFTMYGMVTDYSPSEPDKSIFTSSMVFELMSDTSHAAISVSAKDTPA